jgi:NitT/TauT family transport system ATP-binding protein
MIATSVSRREADADLPANDAPLSTSGMHVSLRGIRHGFVHDADKVIRAVWDIDLEIPAGEFVCLVGPSGCGKTTLLGMIAGLETPREGVVERDRKPVRSTSPDVAYMLARDALLPWLTARENVELGLRVRGLAKAERHRRSDEWLRRVGLSEFTRSSILRLSQGMRQRVAIARTLAMTPKCILLDEPFAALDAQTRVLIQQEFVELWERERQTVVFVTHDLSEAILLGDRIVLMSKRPGRIVADIRVAIPRPRNLDFPYANEGFEEYHKLLSNRLRDEVRAAETIIDQ